MNLPSWWIGAGRFLSVGGDLDVPGNEPYDETDDPNRAESALAPEVIAASAAPAVA